MELVCIVLAMVVGAIVLALVSKVDYGDPLEEDIYKNKEENKHDSLGLAHPRLHD